MNDAPVYRVALDGWMLDSGQYPDFHVGQRTRFAPSPALRGARPGDWVSWPVRVSVDCFHWRDIHGLEPGAPPLTHDWRVVAVEIDRTPAPPARAGRPPVAGLDAGRRALRAAPPRPGGLRAHREHR